MFHAQSGEREDPAAADWLSDTDMDREVVALRCSLDVWEWFPWILRSIMRTLRSSPRVHARLCRFREHASPNSILSNCWLCGSLSRKTFLHPNVFECLISPNLIPSTWPLKEGNCFNCFRLSSQSSIDLPRTNPNGALLSANGPTIVLFIYCGLEFGSRSALPLFQRAHAICLLWFGVAAVGQCIRRFRTVSEELALHGDLEEPVTNRPNTSEGRNTNPRHNSCRSLQSDAKVELDRIRMVRQILDGGGCVTVGG
jgi:hypothetical protein